MPFHVTMKKPGPGIVSLETDHGVRIWSDEPCVSPHRDGREFGGRVTIAESGGVRVGVDYSVGEVSVAFGRPGLIVHSGASSNNLDIMSVTIVSVSSYFRVGGVRALRKRLTCEADEHRCHSC